MYFSNTLKLNYIHIHKSTKIIGKIEIKCKSVLLGYVYHGVGLLGRVQCGRAP